MTVRAIEEPNAEQGADSAGPAEHRERLREARRHVSALLGDLPAGFVVFENVPLPKPTRSTINQLVVGPRNVWAVTTHVVDDPVTRGHARNADTLWAGRLPLRAKLEAADWESSTVGDLLGFEVSPLVCLVAPSLPEQVFEIQGIRICGPDTILEQVATSTADFIDVARVADVVRRTFGHRITARDGGAVARTPASGPCRTPALRRVGTGRSARGSTGCARSLRSGSGSSSPSSRSWSASIPTIIDLWDSVASAERHGSTR